jgi:ribosomal protein S18 acetylase RimI-like enzyme
VHRVGLNVFGTNQTAIRLYESLGYEVLSQQMAKRLTP